MSKERELLRRLVEWGEHDTAEMTKLGRIVTAAQTLLATPESEEGPVAEGTVGLRHEGGRWIVGWHPDVTDSEIREIADEPDEPLVRIRIPVPKYIYAPEPIVGRVVEDKP